MGCTGSKSSEVASRKQEPSGGLKNPVSSSNGTTKNISSIPAESNVDEASMNHVPDIITISDKNENVPDEAGNRSLAQINEEETGNEQENDVLEETGDEKKESEITSSDEMNSRKRTSSTEEQDTGMVLVVDFASRLCNSLFYRLIPSGNHFLPTVLCFCFFRL